MNLIFLTLLTLTFQTQRLLSSLDLLSTNTHLNTYRFFVAKNNIDFIESHNSANINFKMKAYPQFIGLTMEQISAYTLAPLAESVEIVDTAFKAIFNQQNRIKPKGAYFVDLRRNNFNTSVKFQGWKCVNGYAYAVADLMDMLSLQTNVGWGTISAQALTDCSSDASLSVDYRNQGCGGGLLNKTLIYAVSRGVYELNNYAINNQSVNQGINSSCKTARGMKRRLAKWIDLPSNNPNSRASALKNRRPVLSAIAAANRNFVFYQSGIISSCNDNRLGHSVIIVGFSYNSQYGNYWIVKNSWGTDWGEGGYARIEMGESCGLMVKGYVASL